MFFSVAFGEAGVFVAPAQSAFNIVLEELLDILTISPLLAICLRTIDLFRLTSLWQ